MFRPTREISVFSMFNDTTRNKHRETFKSTNLINSFSFKLEIPRISYAVYQTRYGIARPQQARAKGRESL